MTRRTTILGLVGLLAVVSLVVVPIVAAVTFLGGTPMGGWHWNGGPMHDPGTGMGVAPLFALVGVLSQLALFALLAAGGYLAYRAVTRERERRDPALEELRQAYARGDIDEDEYDRRHNKLEDEE